MPAWNRRMPGHPARSRGLRWLERRPIPTRSPHIRADQQRALPRPIHAQRTPPGRHAQRLPTTDPRNGRNSVRIQAHRPRRTPPHRPLGTGSSCRSRIAADRLRVATSVIPPRIRTGERGPSVGVQPASTCCCSVVTSSEIGQSSPDTRRQACSSSIREIFFSAEITVAWLRPPK